MVRPYDGDFHDDILEDDMTRRFSTEQAFERLAERFWSKVLVQGPNDCWPWTGRRTKGGYGQIFVATSNRPEYAHRVALYLKQGVWPMQANHTCDNPPCCNTNEGHVYEGTQQDNIQDMHNRGRAARPEDRSNTALTPHLAAEIRARYLAGETQKALGTAYGVHPGTIGDIIRGKSWRCAGVVPPTPDNGTKP